MQGCGTDPSRSPSQEPRNKGKAEALERKMRGLQRGGGGIGDESRRDGAGKRIVLDSQTRRDGRYWSSGSGVSWTPGPQPERPGATQMPN